MGSHLKVGHEVSEDRRAFLLQQALQGDDDRNHVLYEDLLLDLWIKAENLRAAQCFIFYIIIYILLYRGDQLVRCITGSQITARVTD